MCGIIGGYFKNCDDFIKHHEKLYHRGKDFINYKIYKEFYIGHNRLSINGGASNIQPLEDEDLIISFNGEIFNSTINKCELPNH